MKGAVAGLRRGGPWLAVALMIAVDAFVLGGVAANRAGQPESVLTLTERELPIASTWKEDSGLWLRVDWNSYDSRGLGPSPPWQTVQKMSALGFDVSMPVEDPDAQVFYRKARPIECFGVFEFEGDSWKRFLEREEAHIRETEAQVASGKWQPDTLDTQRENLARDRVSRSRLQIVDLGKDAAALRQSYPDRSRYLITRMVVGLSLAIRRQPNNAETHLLELEPEEVLPEMLQVPSRVRSLPEALRRRREEDKVAHPEEAFGLDCCLQGPPRYEVEVRYGGHHEPWIVAIRPREAEAGGQAPGP